MDYQKFTAAAIGTFLLFMAGCRIDSVTTPATQYSMYEPVLADRSAIERIAFIEAMPIQNAGKIYIYGRYVLVNEIDKGYHIIDNLYPAQPKNIGFWAIPASRELTVRNNILYCDNATDLISVDASDMQKPKIIGRVMNIFPISEPPDGLPVPQEFAPTNMPPNTVILEWRLRK